jgi:hypothetical protein
MKCGIECLYRKISDNLISGLIDPIQLHYMKFILNFTRIWGSYSGSCEEFCLLGYKAIWSVESQPTFQRTMSFPSSGSMNNLSKNPGWKAGGNQSNRLDVKVKVTLRLKVGQFWCRNPFGAHDHILVTGRHLWFGLFEAPSLTRGRVCHLSEQCRHLNGNILDRRQV